MHDLWPYHVSIDEMPFVNRIFNLCITIYAVRSAKEYGLEELLYAKLLFIFRSSEIRILYTRYPGDRLIKKHQDFIMQNQKPPDDPPRYDSLFEKTQPKQ